MPVESWRVRLSGGDAAAAWDEFITAYRPLILATICHTTSDYDVVMDVFAHICGEFAINNLARLTAFDKRSTHTAKFSSWLVVVVRNETIDWLRKHDRHSNKKRAPLTSAIADEAPLADKLLESDELRARLNDELALLAPTERLAIQMYLLDELPAAEVARLLGWPNAKAVYNCVYRALATLRERLERTGIDSSAF